MSTSLTMAFPLDDRRCPQCGKMFARKYTRDRHLQNIHDVRLPVAIHRVSRTAGTPIPQGDDAVDFEAFPTLHNTATTPVPKPSKRGPSQTQKCRLKRHVELLEYLRNGKKKVVRAIINEADGDIINILCECAHNTLLGNVPVSKAQFCKLKRFKKHLRTLTRKQTSLKKKKKILQTGGFLPALLGAALPIITNLVGGLFR